MPTQQDVEAELPEHQDQPKNLEAEFPKTIVKTDKGNHQHSSTGDSTIAKLPKNPEAKHTEDPETELPENLEAKLPETIVETDKGNHQHSSTGDSTIKLPFC